MIDVSQEGSFGASAAERFFGLIILAVGALAIYFTLTSSVQLNGFTGFLGVLSIILIVLGLLLITAKTE
jgi:hypothetical protein